MKDKYHKQFTPARIALLVISSALIIAWQTWLQFRTVVDPATGQEAIGVIGDKGFGPEEWAPFIGAAIICVIFVIIVDIIVTMATIRRTRKLPEEEKDWEGPSPHADRKIPVEAWSPSPIMQAAIRRTLAKQDQR